MMNLFYHEKEKEIYFWRLWCLKNCILKSCLIYIFNLCKKSYKNFFTKKWPEISIDMIVKTHLLSTCKYFDQSKSILLTDFFFLLNKPLFQDWPLDYRGSVRGVYAPCSLRHFTPFSLLPSIFRRSLLFEHTCAYARWALMHRFLSVCHFTKNKTRS